MVKGAKVSELVLVRSFQLLVCSQRTASCSRFKFEDLLFKRVKNFKRDSLSRGLNLKESMLAVAVRVASRSSVEMNVHCKASGAFHGDSC